MGEKYVDGMPLAAALLRRPAVVVRHQIMAGLAAAGYHDILPAHLGVFQYPGPDGVRPGVLAQRTYASKQAMNHLLHQLEEGGYIRRETATGDRRTRIVRLTDRGWDAASVIGRPPHRWTARRIRVRAALRHGRRVYGPAPVRLRAT